MNARRCLPERIEMNSGSWRLSEQAAQNDAQPLPDNAQSKPSTTRDELAQQRAARFVEQRTNCSGMRLPTSRQPRALYVTGFRSARRVSEAADDIARLRRRPGIA
jgi:hypothetical protein